MKRAARLFAAFFAVILAASLGVALIAAGGPKRGQLAVRAAFDDVGDMATGAPVMMADVTIGHVRSVRLVRARAVVTMAVDRGARVPADVKARVRRTSVLGEKFVDLSPRGGGAGRLLADGATIRHTEVVPDLEDLVGSGTDVIGAVSTSQLALLIDEGARGFRRKGSQLRDFLADLDTVLAGYAGRAGTLDRLITSVDQLASDVGPAAREHAQAVSNLARSVDILARERGRLEDFILEAGRLAAAGRSLLAEHADEMDRGLEAIASVTDAVATRQDELAKVIRYLLGHNQNTHLGVKEEFAQVLNDFVLCGVPGGGEQPNPVESCSNMIGTSSPGGGR